MENIRYTHVFHDKYNETVMPAVKFNGIYVMLKNTEDANEIVNLLVTNFLKDEESNIVAYLGGDSSEYEIMDNIIVFNNNLYGDAPGLFRGIATDKYFIN